jgi:hypothetical protein
MPDGSTNQRWIRTAILADSFAVCSRSFHVHHKRMPHQIYLLTLDLSNHLHTTFCQHVRYRLTISLFLQCTMPRFSQFYSATEAEAAVTVRQLYPQHPEGDTPSSGDDAERLTNYLSGSPAFTLRSRNDVNQPLFRPQSTTQSIGRLLNEPRFSITERRIIQDNRVVYASSSDGSVDWKARSRTPSSDERSPLEARRSSTTSRTTEASTIDDGLEHGRRSVSVFLRDEIMGL